MSKDIEPRPDRNEPKGGAIIADRYQVDRLIARGGMATVYLAHHVKLNRPVALKVLSPPADAEDSGDFEERFRLEAETLASLDHPNIVILHDFGELDDGRFFLAMEYVEGPRLSDVLRDGPLHPERALNLIIQVAAALRYSHKRGVVHRDLKPSNLLIKTKEDNEEQLKVVDFGLVKLTETDQSITRAGLILGSPHCMAPEQVKGLDVDHRADIYAIGVLLFRTLTGQYPFHGPNSAATMIAHLNQPVPSFFTVAPELVCPEGLEDIVRRCLEKNPNDRFDNMQDLMTDLAGCMNIPPEHFRSVSQSHSTIKRAVDLPQQRGRSLVALLLGGVVFAVLLMLAVGAGLALGTGWFGPDPVQIGSGNVVTESQGLADPPPDSSNDGTVTTIPPEPESEPEPGLDDPSLEPGPELEPEPVEPEPEPAPAPKPVVKPRPVRPAPRPRPKPAPAPAPEPEPEEKDPEGYMGLPEDW